MRVFMVGEAANHEATLRAGLDPAVRETAEIVALPRESASDPAHDGEIAAEDVVISLRYRREGLGPRFRFLQVPGAGLDGIVFEALHPETTVCNVFEHESPIGEFVVASLLEWEIGLAAIRRSFKPEKWGPIYRSRVPHGELRGKTVGIIGFGRIGRAIAARAAPFGVRLLALDKAVSEAEGVEVMPPAELPRLLAAADYVVVASPLTDETRGLLDHAAFAAMKSSAVLVNVSRAEIVDEAALYQALETGAIRGASLDVWYRYPTGACDDPHPSAQPFLDLPNALCTPHVSAWTRELMVRRYGVIAENINALIAGRPLRNVIRQGGHS